MPICFLSFQQPANIASQICAGLKALTTSSQYTVQFDSYKRLKLSGISRVSSTQEPADPVWNDASLFPLLSEGCPANTASHDGSAIRPNTNTQIHKHKYKKEKYLSSSSQHVGLPTQHRTKEAPISGYDQQS